MIETLVSSIFVGAGRSYIYIWVSKNYGTLYVGMTNDQVGTLGRAHAHLGNKGTLRKRFNEKHGLNIDITDDLKLLTFVLPNDRKFITVEKSYREAVEYLVQKELLTLCGFLSPPMDVVSWVRASPRTGNSQVIKLAQEIVQKFIANYPAL